MKVTLNWLKQYVEFAWSPEELTERLTMLGLEVESVVKRGGEFEGVVVAQVITRDKHPNADKLSVCRVQDGSGERQIVCGAQNFKAGDKVPLVLPGATLAGKAGEAPFTIKVGKIRGVESHGMMCSGHELGLSEDHEGLMILPPDARVGRPFAEHLGRAGSDVLYDLEVTPNRPDLNSVIGIAREIAALTGSPLRLPAVELPGAAAAPGSAGAIGTAPAADRPAGGSGVAAAVAVRLDDPALCARYTARLIRGVKIGPSPAWLRSALESVGLRSINNVVDVTNYVMLETGQPLHAFDYHLLARPEGAARPTIVVRRAQPGELFVTLDGQKHTLTGEMLLIADETRAVALAGIMGGQNSEINDRTADVLLESAWFKPTNIRRTSKQLGLRTDASYRFERGADIGVCEWASRRAAQLILQTAGGQLAAGVVDAYPQPAQPGSIELRHRKAGQLLGVDVPAPEQIRFLERLGLQRENAGTGPQSSPQDALSVFRIPTFRVDLKRETDLIEEIGRLFGVDRIPATPPRGTVGANEYDTVHDQLAEARRILAGLGLNEAQGQTLIGEAAARLVASETDLVLLANPLSSEMNTLRPSLLPGLLDSLKHNLNRKNDRVALFEIGRVFLRREGQPREERRLAVALTGPRANVFWTGDDREAKADLYDLKGALDGFLEAFGVRGVTLAKRAASTALFLESALVSLGGKVPLGELGQVLPPLAKHYDLRDAVLVAELNLDQLLARRIASKGFKPLPQFPSVRRDVAMLVPEALTHDDVLQAARRARPANMEAVELFDVFRGAHVPDGQKSVAYAFTYRHAERTLTDAEVNAAHDTLVEQLKAALAATVR